MGTAVANPATPSSTLRLSAKLRGLLESPDTPIVGPNTAGELRVWIAAAEAALPALATPKEIEAGIALLALATKEKAGTTRADAHARLELFCRVLADVRGTDLDRGITKLLRTTRWMPTPAEVREAAMASASRRDYAISRARHLVWKHETQYAPPPLDPVAPEELAGLLAEAGAALDVEKTCAQPIAAEPNEA